MWTWVGESAIVVRYPDGLAEANAAARRAAAAAAGFPDVEEAVPGARSVLVRLRGDRDPSPALLAALERPPETPDEASDEDAVVVDVVYDGEDLDAVAAECGLDRAGVVAAHTAADYVVAFNGFMPGFAYLLGVPDALRVPRLATPRPRVPAGSVAVAGPYSGVYPSASPGGWRLLGRTRAILFDASAAQPCLLRPGRRVRFADVSESEGANR